MAATKDWKRLLRKAIQRLNKGKWTRSRMERDGAYCATGAMCVEGGLPIAEAMNISFFEIDGRLGLPKGTTNRIVGLNDSSSSWPEARAKIVAEMLGVQD